MTDKRVVKAVEEANAEDHSITLSTGVVLRGKQAPPLIMVKVMAAFPRPKVPTWFNDKMGREMENPDDPDYIERIGSWKIEYSNATLNALILLGTELVSAPKGFPGPNSDEWLDEYKLLGVETMPQNKNWRYLNWVIFKAAADANDLKLIKEVVGRLSGIREADVAAAQDFPGR